MLWLTQTQVSQHIPELLKQDLRDEREVDVYIFSAYPSVQAIKECQIRHGATSQIMRTIQATSLDIW